MARVERQGLVIDRPVGRTAGARWKQTSEGPIDSGSTFQSSIWFIGHSRPRIGWQRWHPRGGWGGLPAVVDQ